MPTSLLVRQPTPEPRPYSSFAVSTEEAISFRMIHEPTGKPTKLVKGVIYGEEFTEVPEEEIVKG